MTVFLPLLIALIGLVVYLVTANPKVAELARLAYAVGLLAFLLQVSGQVVSLLNG